MNFGAPCISSARSKVTLSQIACICTGKGEIFLLPFLLLIVLSFCCLLGGSVFYYKFGTIIAWYLCSVLKKRALFFYCG